MTRKQADKSIAPLIVTLATLRTKRREGETMKTYTLTDAAKLLGLTHAGNDTLDTRTEGATIIWRPRDRSVRGRIEQVRGVGVYRVMKW